MDRDAEARELIAKHGVDKIGRAMGTLLTQYEEDREELRKALKHAVFIMESAVMLQGMKDMIPHVKYLKNVLGEDK